MMPNRTHAVALILMLLSPAVCASQAQLANFFDQVNTLSAKFEQRVVDESGMTLEASSGRFYLSRPGKFRWDYNSNDPDLALGPQLVADGTHLFMFDPDLETVKKNDLNGALGQVPSLLLVQSGENLDEYFTVSDFGLTDGLTWVGLKPKDESAAYSQLLIGFMGDELNTINLTDGLGNETRLRLSDVKTNPVLPVDWFDFVPPEGADVIGE